VVITVMDVDGAVIMALMFCSSDAIADAVAGLVI